jgi:hypothetical protein
MGKLHATRESSKQWGELPAHERDRILQSMTEGFPAHYQAVLEEYFKRLADEKPPQPDDQSPPADKPTTAPAEPAKPQN